MHRQTQRIQNLHPLTPNEGCGRPPPGVGRGARRRRERGVSEQQKKEILPMERIKMVMTRSKDDEKALYDLLGNNDDRKKFDTQFKKAESNFKIAIVVDPADAGLTGFDPPSPRLRRTGVPFLDTR